MKHLELSGEEQRTLREMGVFYPHPRTRIRAQGLLRLSQGLALQRTADEFGVHLNSVEHWRQRWDKLGLAGLYEGPQGDGFHVQALPVQSKKSEIKRRLNAPPK